MFYETTRRIATGAVIMSLGAAGLFTTAATAADAALDGPGWSVRVSQESAPGAGDFDKNFLGTVRPFETQATTPVFYGYADACYCGDFIRLRLLPERTQMVFLDAADGMTMMVVHDDDLEDADGGWTEMRFELIGDPDGMYRSVYDDPVDVVPDSDIYTGEPGDRVFTSAHLWSQCCTDGDAFTGFGATERPPVYGTTEYFPVSLIVEFTEVDGDPATSPIQGLETWTVVSANGQEFELVLEEDLRVRLDVIQTPPSCPGDADGDGLVGFTDLLTVLSNWGPCP